MIDGGLHKMDDYMIGRTRDNTEGTDRSRPKIVATALQSLFAIFVTFCSRLLFSLCR